MIFVTVGTHEQQFNRLVEEIDRLALILSDEVFVQTGYSTYEPKNCRWSHFLTAGQMNQYNDEARIIITHGGPSSFIAAIQRGKIPIVVPRQSQYGEHVNDHQVHFCEIVETRMKNIIMIKDISEIEKVIENYNNISSKMKLNYKNNNAEFCETFSKLVDNLF